MIDTDKYEGLTIDDWYKMNHHDWKDVVNEHNDLLAEVKRLREDNELYLVCINTSQYKHEPGSAFRELGAVRQWQGRQWEHVGALRCIYGKNPQSFVPLLTEGD